jgi:hypothetical protein
LAEIEADFDAKCKQFLNNEKILKQNMEVLQKYSEDLEKERTNERTLRLKLEEEYMQNSKNHEEEVQLRLKFESKLNSMHSLHRELEMKYKRVQSELFMSNERLANMEITLAETTKELALTKTLKVELETDLGVTKEKLVNVERDLHLKNRVL